MQAGRRFTPCADQGITRTRPAHLDRAAPRSLLPTAVPQRSSDQRAGTLVIGAHAAHQADVFFTRDCGFYGRGFRVRVIDPAAD